MLADNHSCRQNYLIQLGIICYVCGLVDWCNGFDVNS